MERVRGSRARGKPPPHLRRAYSPRRCPQRRSGHPGRHRGVELYAAEEVGTVWGAFTHSGGGLTDALIFGHLAGQHAARSG